MTAEQESVIGLLSDDELYGMAEALVRQHRILTSSDMGRRQVASLLRYAEQSLDDLNRFIDNQAAKHESAKDDQYNLLFASLKQSIGSVRDRARDPRLVSPGLPKKQVVDELKQVSLRLVQEFLHHVAAEARFRQNGGG